MNLERMEERCRKCNSILYKKALLDNKGNIGMDGTTHAEWEHEENELFFRCRNPSCRAKNIIIATKSPDGLQQFEIVGFKD